MVLLLGCFVVFSGYETRQMDAMSVQDLDKTKYISRHRTRRPVRGRDLYVTVSELQLVATGRLEVTCVSTIPEFRSIEDRFADVRNETVIVDVHKMATHEIPENFTSIGSSTSEANFLYSQSLIYLLTIPSVLCVV